MENNENKQLDRLSYALGLSMGNNFRASGIDKIDVADFADGVAAVFYGSQPKMTYDEAKTVIREYFTEMEKKQQAEAAIIAELEGLKNGPITQEEVDDCRRGLLSSMDALGDSLAALENWYYGQITRGEPLYPPEYGKVLTSAVSLDEVRQTLQSYSYSVCYAVTAEPGTQGKGGSEDVE